MKAGQKVETGRTKGAWSFALNLIFAGTERGNDAVKRKGHAAEQDKRSTRIQKPADWDEHLRQVGDARYVEVEWSTRDRPSWPLPNDR